MPAPREGMTRIFASRRRRSGQDCHWPLEMNHPSGGGPNARRRGRCAGRSRALGQPSQMGGQAPISSVVGLFGRRGAASPDTTAKAATPVSAADANVSLRVWCDEEREPSRLCSGTSCGLLGTGLCGIGGRPSAVASRPVRIASTPGASAAAATSILACACGERRMYAKACPGRLKSFAYGLGPSADAHPRAAERICRCLAEKVALGNPETTLDAMSWTTSDLLSPAHVSWGKTFRSASWT